MSMCDKKRAPCISLHGKDQRQSSASTIRHCDAEEFAKKLSPGCCVFQVAPFRLEDMYKKKTLEAFGDQEVLWQDVTESSKLPWARHGASTRSSRTHACGRAAGVSTLEPLEPLEPLELQLTASFCQVRFRWRSHQSDFDECLDWSAGHEAFDSAPVAILLARHACHMVVSGLQNGRGKNAYVFGKSLKT